MRDVVLVEAAVEVIERFAKGRFEVGEMVLLSVVVGDGPRFSLA